MNKTYQIREYKDWPIVEDYSIGDFYHVWWTTPNGEFTSGPYKGYNKARILDITPYTPKGEMKNYFNHYLTLECPETKRHTTTMSCWVDIE